MGSRKVLAALPHLEKVMNLGQSMLFSFLRIYLHFRVVSCEWGIQFSVSACQNPVIGSCKLPDNDCFAKGLACGF